MSDSQSCKSCGESKPLNETNWRRTPIGSFYKKCKRCYWLEEKARRAENTRKVQEMKVEAGCRVCGYNKSPYALQFNHINPEDKTHIKSNPRTAYHPRWKMSRILEELSKCEVLCANCHAEHTHNSGAYWDE